MDDIDAIVAGLSEAQKQVLASGNVPNEYLAKDALDLQRLGLLVFTPMGDVISSPLGMAVRARLMDQSPTIATPASTQA